MKRGFFPFFLLISGCMVGPNYHPPEIHLSNTWNSQADTAEPSQKWWEEFDDPLLNQYIQWACVYNYDLQSSEANILRARALRQIAASKLFPNITADLNGTKTYFSKNGPVFAIGQAAGNPQNTPSATTGLPFAIQAPQIQNLFNALFDASWELDFFGKNRRSVESALAEYESLIEQKNGVLLSVLAEVARNYIELRCDQVQIDLLQTNILLFEKHRTIIQASLQCGYSNQLDLETADAELANAKAALPEIFAELYRSIYALSILVGRPPEALIDELLIERPLPKTPSRVAVGLRSDLLRQRPDVRYAERKLAEATANIGVAIASFYPSFSLLANAGMQSLALPKLFEWGSKTWAYGADVSMPIFEGGNLIGNLRLSQAEQAFYAAQYQQTVLRALQDAENSLKKYEQTVKASQEHDQNVMHSERLATLTRERHLKGLVNLIDVLNQEKRLISSKLSQIDLKKAEFFSLISLYKALGN